MNALFWSKFESSFLMPANLDFDHLYDFLSFSMKFKNKKIKDWPFGFWKHMIHSLIRYAFYEISNQKKTHRTFMIVLKF